MGGLAILETNDVLRVDLAKRRVDLLLTDDEIEQRRQALVAAGGFAYPPDQTPWQQIQRNLTNQFDEGAVLSNAPNFQRIAQTHGVPRDSH